MRPVNIFSVPEETDSIGDAIVRLGITVFFGAFGLEKFSSDPGSHWVQLFHQIGLGDWFRYFTGVVEVLGAMLALIPRTALVAMALLAATMLGAVLILAFIIHTPGDAAFPGIFRIILLIIGGIRLNHLSDSAQ